MQRFIEIWVLLFQIVIGVFIFFGTSIFLSKKWGAPWVISSQKKISRMLELVELKASDTLIDLGAGDGRILIYAAHQYGCKAIGVEIDPIRFILANIFIRWHKVGKLAQIHWGNIFEFDISSANVVTVYLTRQANAKLLGYFEEHLRPGSKIVSNAFPIKEWTPILIDDSNYIFVYEIGRTGIDTHYEFV
ncbi:MAG: class I SAM-dependent methyltransferase [Chloroflexota bacterium]